MDVVKDLVDVVIIVVEVVKGELEEVGVLDVIIMQEDMPIPV